MKNKFILFVSLLLLLVLTPVMAQDVPADSPETPVFTRNWDVQNHATPTGRWVVQLADESGLDALDGVMSANAIEPLAGLANTYIITPAGDNLTEGVDAGQTLQALPGVVYAEPEYLLRNERYVVPSDPLFGDQFHLKHTGQYNAPAGHDVRAEAAWDAGYTGAGVIVGINDDGYQTSHADLDAPKYVANRSYDYGDSDTNPNPFLGSDDCFGTGGGIPDDCHGTSVAGITAAQANNNVCGAGVAYDANMAGLRFNFATGWTDSTEAQMYLNALAQDKTPLDVVNHSWGPSGGGAWALTTTQNNALIQGATQNNTIYVFAAGNSHNVPAQTGRNGYATSRYTIAVGATDVFGEKSFYSEEGGAVLVNAPSSGTTVGTTTSDLIGSAGYGGYGSFPDCTNDFGGTSSAAPTVSGVIALMLEANPNLTWRDVQHILVETSRQNDPTDPSWQTNGAGFHTSYKYGFGTVNAGAATAAAATWQTVGTYMSETTSLITGNIPIPDGTSGQPWVYGQAVSNSRSVTSNIDKLEHVEVIFYANHGFEGDLRVRLVSPSGTESELMDVTNNESIGYANGWTFMSTQFWGEDPDGTWTIYVDDGWGTLTGSFTGWQMVLYGTEAQTSNIDLVADSFTADDMLMPAATGYETDLSFRVANNGSTDSGAFDVDLHYSTDFTCDNGDDVFLQTVNISNVVAGGNQTRTISVTVPYADIVSDIDNGTATNEPAGTSSDFIAFLCMVVDANDSVSETDENNNTNTGDQESYDDVTAFPYDVDGDGQATPVDAILLINRLNTSPSDPAYFIDGQAVVSSNDVIDVLLRLGMVPNTDVVEVVP